MPNLLLQKFSSPSFSATTKIAFHPSDLNDKSGLVIMGQEWAYLALYKTSNGVRLGMFTGHYEQGADATQEIKSIQAKSLFKNQYTYYLKVEVEEGGKCQFFYSLDGQKFSRIGDSFQAKKGVWIGAKMGIFSLTPNIVESEGFADFDWFKVN